nr:MAG TPA: hypothetical protein [Caudoviricetes sp.]
MPVKSRLRKKIHTKYIEDVVCEISQANEWRQALFSSPAGQSHEISRRSEIPLPAPLEGIFKRYPLTYFVGVFPSDNMVVFEFSPKSFPEVKRWSCNRAPVNGELI